MNSANDVIKEANRVAENLHNGNLTDACDMLLEMDQQKALAVCAYTMHLLFFRNNPTGFVPSIALTLATLLSDRFCSDAPIPPAMERYRVHTEFPPDCKEQVDAFVLRMTDLIDNLHVNVGGSFAVFCSDNEAVAKDVANLFVANFDWAEFGNGGE